VFNQNLDNIAFVVKVGVIGIIDFSREIWLNKGNKELDSSACLRRTDGNEVDFI